MNATSLFVGRQSLEKLSMENEQVIIITILNGVLYIYPTQLWRPNKHPLTSKIFIRVSGNFNIYLLIAWSRGVLNSVVRTDVFSGNYDPVLDIVRR